MTKVLQGNIKLKKTHLFLKKLKYFIIVLQKYLKFEKYAYVDKKTTQIFLKVLKM